MEFEWDEYKNLANIRKHGISFQRAATIFAGNVLSFKDARHDYGEVRTLNIGITDDTALLLVVSTDRDGRLRIISARPANTKERRLYHAYTQEA